jgi:hypothetical protein
MKIPVFFSWLIICTVAGVVAQTPKVILADDFSDNKNNWPVYRVKNTNYLVYNGKLVIDTQDTTLYNVGIPVGLNPDGNYSITVTATHTGGVENYGFGLFFGASDVNNYFNFFITSNGFFRIGKNTSAGFTELVKWTTLAAIKTGNYVDNQLTLSKEGASWKFQINGQTAATIPALPFLGKIIGVSKANDQRIEFDDLKIVEY